VVSRSAAKPFEDCYWVIPGVFLAGEYPGAPLPAHARLKLSRLLDVGITYVMDLTSKADPLRPYDKQLRELAKERGISVVYSRRPIPDMNCPSADLMRTILDEIDEAIANGHLVYVHCWGGIGRTGTVVGCQLVRAGATGDEALAHVARLFAGMSRSKTMVHRRSPQTLAQRAFVRGWTEP
jgi:protein-tyrosine phosphatase